MFPCSFITHMSLYIITGLICFNISTKVWIICLNLPNKINTGILSACFGDRPCQSSHTSGQRRNHHAVTLSKYSGHCTKRLPEQTWLGVVLATGRVNRVTPADNAGTIMPLPYQNIQATYFISCIISWRNWCRLWSHGCGTTDSQISPQPKNEVSILFYHGNTKLTLNQEV